MSWDLNGPKTWKCIAFLACFGSVLFCFVAFGGICLACHGISSEMPSSLEYSHRTPLRIPENRNTA